MRWTKLKQSVEAQFCDAVRERVGLWTTRYHNAHDQTGRSWITVDGKEIVNMQTPLAIDENSPERISRGEFCAFDLPLAMRQFQQIAVDEALKSENPILRALAILDRRVGRRRLRRMNIVDELPWVRQLYELRVVDESDPIDNSCNASASLPIGD